MITLQDKEIIEVRMQINIINMGNKVRIKMLYKMDYMRTW